LKLHPVDPVSPRIEVGTVYLRAGSIDDVLEHHIFASSWFVEFGCEYHRGAVAEYAA
jgi:hypothetical protein